MIGEGFHGAGNYLPGLKLNEYEGRVKGLSAAQKRLDTQRKIGKGGVLGGSGTAGKTMKEVLAEVRLPSGEWSDTDWGEIGCGEENTR